MRWDEVIAGDGQEKGGSLYRYKNYLAEGADHPVTARSAKVRPASGEPLAQDDGRELWVVSGPAPSPRMQTLSDGAIVCIADCRSAARRRRPNGRTRNSGHPFSSAPNCIGKRGARRRKDHARIAPGFASRMATDREGS